ncbi:MAG: transcriptional regulator [Gemmatimonadales bacterium]|nr:transcriptional regulator [Gemmatimonadales bacterium]
MVRTSKSDSGRSGRSPLSPVIHGRARLLILSLLLRTGKSINFTSLRDELEYTDGSLSVHLGKLEEAGLVTLEKAFVGKKPQTSIKLTPTGRRQFNNYVKELRSIVPGLGEAG